MIGPAIVVAAASAFAQAPDLAELTAMADRFDRAQINKDRAALEAMTAPDLIFVGSDGRRQDQQAFILGWLEPAITWHPITVTDRYFLPLGTDSVVVGGDVVLRWTAGGESGSARIRFADTFRRIGGVWKAVHIQATRVPAQ